MEQYIVSARKYRPDTFGSLVGQDNIARTLKNSILRGQLAHAYLFCGPRGVGKTSTARIFAKTINCLNPGPDMDPCGVCESCVSFNEGRSFSIHELDAASNNGVEDIKVLMDKVRIPPQIGRYSVFIIDEVHMLSQAAFNAFLKTLEEPPAHAIFILATTEKHKILPTILSRCQTYDFNRISVEDAVRNLRHVASQESVEISDEALHVIGVKADGAMRDALTLFDQMVAFCGKEITYADVIANLNVLDYEYYFKLTEDFVAGNYQSALLMFDGILAKGFNALHFISGLSSHFRNLAVSLGSSTDSLLDLPESLKERYRQQAATLSLPFIYKALEVSVQCESTYRASVNQRLHIEFALMKLSNIAVPFAVDKPVTAEVVPTVQPAVKEKEVVKATETKARENVAVESVVKEKEVSEVQAVEPKIQETKAPKASARKKPGMGMSISSVAAMLNSGPVAKQEDTPGIEEVVSGKADIDMETLKAVWTGIAEGYKSKPRLYSAISSAKLDIEKGENRDFVVFYVANEAQKEWIQTKLHRELEASIRSGLSSSTVYLKIEALPEEEGAENPRHYMPTEKARYLIESSEEVRNLCADLALDVK